MHGDGKKTSVSEGESLAHLGEAVPENLQWYCVRTKTKSEHLAAAHIKRFGDLEVFCPRIRFQRPTSRGRVWFVEALFPGYVFARFDLGESLRAVSAAPAVIGLIKFGDFFPSVPYQMVEEFRREFDDSEIRIITEDLMAGDEAVIMEGAFKGLSVVVTRLLPARDRVRILLDCLGELREVDASRDSLLRPSDIRDRAIPDRSD